MLHILTSALKVMAQEFREILQCRESPAKQNPIFMRHKCLACQI